MEMIREITTEKTLSNNKSLRVISDWLDGKGFRGAPRALTHSMYHVCIGAAKLLCLNREGSRREFKRAMEQLRRIGQTPPKKNTNEGNMETV